MDSRQRIKEEFTYYLLNIARSSRRTDKGFNLQVTAVQSFLAFLEVDRLFDYNPEIWQHIKSMYDITSPNEVENIADTLLNDENFIKHDNGKNQGWRSGSIIHYVCFIKARSYFMNEKVDIILNSPKEDHNQNQDAHVLSVPFSIARMISLISDTGLLYSDQLIKRFAFSLMSKRFLILSGLAGSGKTQLALAFASALIKDESQMCVVPVGADWTNREPLLGFPNALQENQYVKPESGVLDLLIEANKAENSSKPYFLILDEMNMSYVERYFADFLSAMESHKAIPLWKGEGDVPQSICLPSNLFIVGTINVDETTYMFSPKVLDRANVIEFKISPDEMDTFLGEMKPIDREIINYKAQDMAESFVTIATCKELADDKEIKVTLGHFFKDLKSVNAEFGYRSATEIYRFISQAQKHDDTEKKMSLKDILDCAIVQKLMPKLHGSRKKLDATLNALWKECFEGEVQKETTLISRDKVANAMYPLTADKILRMHDAAMANGFTSFSEA